MMPSKNERKKFIDYVINTRNYLIHHSSLKGKTLNWSRLFWIVQKLKFLIGICLLKELGFTNSEIDEIFTERQINYLTITPV